MKESLKQVQETIQNIEGKKMSVGNNKKKSVDDVIEQLLGHSAQANNDNSQFEKNSALYNAKAKLETINRPEMWNIQFNRNVALPGVKGKIKSVYIRAVRKLIRPVMHAIVYEQTRFNSINVQILNEMQATNTAQERVIQNLVNEIYLLNNKEAEKAEEDVYKVLDYEKFEHNFRGVEEDIKNRQKEYLPYLKNVKTLLDIGCGRGEFLELMRENGIDAMGVDMYSGFVERCVQKGFDVVEDDGIAYLESFDDESLDAITAFQVIEHISTARLVEFCKIAYRKLTRGGVLILETPNPTCLSIYTNSFYIDSTHEKPVHPQALHYYANEAGFTKRETYYTKFSRVPETIPAISGENMDEFNESMNKLTNLIYGSQDYALIATK